jgi:hypothetical protein
MQATANTLLSWPRQQGGQMETMKERIRHLVKIGIRLRKKAERISVAASGVVTR